MPHVPSTTPLAERLGLVPVTTVYHDQFFIERGALDNPDRHLLRVYHPNGVPARYGDTGGYTSRYGEPILLHRGNILEPEGPGTAPTLAGFLKDPDHRSKSDLLALYGRMIFHRTLTGDVYATVERIVYNPNTDIATVTVRRSLVGVDLGTEEITDEPRTFGLAPVAMSRTDIPAPADAPR